MLPLASIAVRAEVASAVHGGALVKQSAWKSFATGSAVKPAHAVRAAGEGELR